MTQALPEGFQVELAPSVRWLNDRRTLVGGSPKRIVRLSDYAATLIEEKVLTVEESRRGSGTLARRLLDANLALPIPMRTASQEDLTVVVPVRDRPQQLDRCLSSLAGLAVIVVDDASEDPEAVAAVVRSHGAELVPLDRNRGPAGARNAGLARVGSPLVAFVDSDVRVQTATLVRLAQHFSDPNLALIGPRVMSQPTTDKPAWFERYDADTSSLDLGRTPCSLSRGADVAWLPSACLVGRVSELQRGFDDSMRVGEDVDLVWRLLDASRTVRYDPKCVAIHDSRPTVRGWLGRKFVYGTGGASLARRHGSRVAPARLSPSMAVAGVAMMQARWWSLPVSLGVAAVTAMRLSNSARLPTGSAGTAVRLSVESVGWSVRQQSALLLRHWWPLSLPLLTTRVGRRAVMTALAVDTAVAVGENVRFATPPALLGRRLDDMAYGAGLWWGAVKDRRLSCLKVDLMLGSD